MQIPSCVSKFGPKTKKENTKETVHRPLKTKLNEAHVRQMCKALRPLHEKVARLNSVVAPPPFGRDEKGWVAIPGPDQKIAVSEAALAASELKGAIAMMRGVIRSSGVGSMKLQTPLSYALTNTAANLSQYVTGLNPVNSNEWTSLQALYDEYRLAALETQVTTLAGSSGAALNLDCGWLCIVYDPIDQTILANVATAGQASRGKLFAIPVNPNAGTGPSSTLTNGRPLRAGPYHIKAEEGLTFDSTGLVIDAPGCWRNLPTAGSTATNDGYLKVFWKTDVAGAATVVASAMVFCTYDFRIRK